MPSAMRIAYMCLVVTALVIAGSADRAAAQDGTATYAVTYLQVADDCEGKGMSFDKGDVVLASGKGKVTVTVPGVPPLEGTQTQKRANSRFKAQAAAPTSKPGISGRYSASGRVGKGKIQMVFIAEFYKGKKPLCTQSWSAQGNRK